MWIDTVQKRKWTDEKKREVGRHLQYLKGLAYNDDDNDGFWV